MRPKRLRRRVKVPSHEAPFTTSVPVTRQEAHKRKLGVAPPDATIRVFWANAAARDSAAAELDRMMGEMMAAVQVSVPHTRGRFNVLHCFDICF